MSTGLAIPLGTGLSITTIPELEKVAAFFARSGLFRDAVTMERAFVKIFAGANLGLDPLTSMTGLHIVEGKICLDGTLVGALIQRSEKYDYHIVEASGTRCEIDFFEGDKKLGTSIFTIEMARTAGLTRKDNWQKYPDAMLRARAMTQGARFYTPAVFLGPVYTPEELNAEPANEAIPGTMAIAPGVPTYQNGADAEPVRDVTPHDESKAKAAADTTTIEQPAVEPTAVAATIVADAAKKAAESLTRRREAQQSKHGSNSHILALVSEYNDYVEDDATIRQPVRFLRERGLVHPDANEPDAEQREEAVKLFEDMIEKERARLAEPKPKLGAPVHAGT